MPCQGRPRRHQGHLVTPRGELRRIDNRRGVPLSGLPTAPHGGGGAAILLGSGLLAAAGKGRMLSLWIRHYQNAHTLSRAHCRAKNITPRQRPRRREVGGAARGTQGRPPGAPQGRPARRLPGPAPRAATSAATGPVRGRLARSRARVVVSHPQPEQPMIRVCGARRTLRAEFKAPVAARVCSMFRPHHLPFSI